MTAKQWNDLVFFLSDLKDTERNHKTRTIDKKRCAEISEALDVLMQESMEKVDINSGP